MEEITGFDVAHYFATLIDERWLEIAVGLSLLALWRWLMGHKLRNRIVALEAKERSSGINQVITIQGDVTQNYGRHLRDAIDAKTVQSLVETVRSLPQVRLGDGVSYAKLPNHTNIVTMADGSMRLALPIFLSAAFEGGLRGELNAAVELGDRPKDKG